MTDAWRIIFRRPGGPEVLEREDLALAEPGVGQARIRITAIGLNFIDTYQRSGLYSLPLPSGLGSEFAGIVEAVGTGVSGFAPGDRVAALMRGTGGYATHIICNADELTTLPMYISDEIAAAVMLKGLTAWMLIERCARLKEGQTILIHSAAGGVGAILVPWAKAAGAIVITHAGNARKADHAIKGGADHAFCEDFDALPAQVREVTAGRGVDVVLDGVGAASWAASLAAVARRGLIVSYGNASGPVPPVAPLELMRAGSIFLTRPTVSDYASSAEERTEGVNRLFALIAERKISIEIGQRFALADAAEAHRMLEARKTIGSTILIP